MAHDICPSCGGAKDRRAKTCVHCRPTTPRQPEWGVRKPATLEHAAVKVLAAAVRNDDGCLIASTGQQQGGYRKMEIAGKGWLLHRLVMVVHLGRMLAPAETVDHDCHNMSNCSGGPNCPHRACVDVTHLAVRTRTDNWRRGRLGAPAQRRAKTHCPQGHEYTEANTYTGYKGYRKCRTCARLRAVGKL